MSEITRLRSLVEEGTSEHVRSLVSSHAKLLDQVGEMRDEVENIKDIHDKACVKALMFLGGGVQAASDLVTLINGDKMRMVTNDYVLDAPPRWVEAIEKKRDHQGSPRRRRKALKALVERLPDDEDVKVLLKDRPFIGMSGEVRKDGKPLQERDDGT